MKNVALKSLFIIVVITLITFSCKKSDVEPTMPVGTGEFAFASTKYSGGCFAVPSSSCSGSTDVMIVSDNKINTLIVYNMPDNTSGTYTISNGWNSATDCGVLYVLAVKDASGITASINGTLTKTGATTFALTTSVTDDPSTSASTATTARGNYQKL